MVSYAAFVFDTVTRNQSIYLNGVLDASRQANNSYQGGNGSLDIGIASWASGSRYFNGLIDQLSFTNRSKTAQEILRDATLTSVLLIRQTTPPLDEGPLGINGSLVGNTSFAAGRRGQALQIGNVNDSYLTVARSRPPWKRRSVLLVLDLDQASCTAESVDHSHVIGSKRNGMVCTSYRSHQYKSTR